MQADYPRLFHLLAGPTLGGAAAALVPDAYTDPAGMSIALSSAAHATVGCLVWMAWWWFTEPVPLAVTSLIPALWFPLLGVAAPPAAFAPYADPLLFLFFGGFVLAAAIEKWNLHRRFALTLLGLSGGHARRLVLALMVATAFISLWLSNTATAVLMFPVALSLARHTAVPDNLRKCLVLAVAYAATIGGIGTLIGTPPNLFVASYLRSSHGVEIDFAHWLALGLPVVAVMLPATFWLMTRLVFPVSDARVELDDWRADSGWDWRALTPQARATLLVFGAAALGWMSRGFVTQIELAGGRPFAALTDTTIALAAAVALFMFPLGRAGGAALHWEDTRGLPWGTLLLFGGGLSLAAAISANGVDAALAAGLAGAPRLPAPLVIAAIATTVIFVSEIASNIATAAAMTPLLAAAAPALGLQPVEAALVTALAASSAYMLPVGTAPNALAYGSGIVTTRDMIKAGFLLNVLSILLITAIGTFLVPLVT